jgi:hypothetical protein
MISPVAAAQAEGARTHAAVHDGRAVQRAQHPHDLRLTAPPSSAAAPAKRRPRAPAALAHRVEHDESLVHRLARREVHAHQLMQRASLRGYAQRDGAVGKQVKLFDAQKHVGWARKRARSAYVITKPTIAFTPPARGRREAAALAMYASAQALGVGVKRSSSGSAAAAASAAVLRGSKANVKGTCAVVFVEILHHKLHRSVGGGVALGHVQELAAQLELVRLGVAQVLRPDVEW